MSTSIPKPLFPGKDPPDNSSTPSIKASKSPQQASSILEQPTEPTRAPFSGFFTLITDPNTSSAYHPTQVHYVFSDDDPEILTTACLSAISPSSPSASTKSGRPFSTSSSSTSAGPSSKNPSSKAYKQQIPITTTTKEAPAHRDQRTIILTLSETGDTVIAAHSLTPTWQILNTEITNAPTWDAANAEGTSQAGGLMLKIEGTDGSAVEEINTAVNTIPQISGGSGKYVDSQRDVGIDMQALMESFDAKMSMLRKVIQAGGSTLNGAAQPEAEDIAPEETAEAE